MQHLIDGYNAFWEPLFKLPWSRILEVIGWLGGLGTMIAITVITTITVATVFHWATRK